MTPHITDEAHTYLNRMFPNSDARPALFSETDPEFTERFANFAFDQVIDDGAPDGTPLPDRTRFMVVLAALLGCQGIDEYRIMAPAALEMGLEPVAVKEIVYQATAYLGIGRVFPFLKATNDVFAEAGIELPLPSQANTEPTYDSRAKAGEAKQVAYFGEGMRGFANAGNPEYPQINRWLASNCFGDWYTRDGLTDAERELATFCFLIAQGGCEPQATSHARANMNLGNDKAFLLKAVSAALPFIGYPRSLNAIACIEKAAEA